MNELTAEVLRQAIQYDPETGSFQWLERPRDHFANEQAWSAWNTKYAGKKVGRKHGEGYVCMNVGGKTYLAHRLAWLHMTGSWPVNDVDHINGERSDNRWINLRDVTRSVNLQNVRSAKSHNKSTGLLGVSAVPSSLKFRALLQVSGKQRCLGYFDTPEDAHAAYVTAKRDLHEGCTL